MQPNTRSIRNDVSSWLEKRARVCLDRRLRQTLKNLVIRPNEAGANVESIRDSSTQFSLLSGYLEAIPEYIFLANFGLSYHIAVSISLYHW
jgi:hypothetical protein